MAYDSKRRSNINKLLTEDYKVAVDFSEILNGRTLVSGAVATINADTKQLDNSITPDTPTISGTSVLVRLTAGVRGRMYQSSVYATLSTGEVYGHLLEIEVI